ncbi:MAG: hypothetical protein ACRD47_17150 [Nitrososphaeraceae archaeon]
MRSELKAKCMVHNGLVSSSGWHAREGPVVAVIMTNDSNNKKDKCPCPSEQ